MVEITKKYLLRQGFWIYLFTFLAAPLGYLIRILYARTFSVEEFGLIYSIIGFMALISIFNDLGFSETLNYHATRFFEKKQYSKVKGSFIFALLMQGGTAVLLGIIFWLIAPWLAENYFKSPQALWIFRSFIMYFLFYNVSKPLVQLFVATHNYLFNSMAEFIRQFITIGLSGLILFFNQLHNVVFIAIVWGIAYLVLFLGYYFLAHKFYPKVFKVKADLSKKLYKKLWKYAIVIVWGICASVILSRIDIIMITHFLDLKQVAYYSAALSVASLLPIIGSPFVSLLFPLTSKLSINKEKAKIKKLIEEIYKKGIFFTTPLLVLMMSFPKEILRLLYGDKYVVSAALLIILSMAFFVNLLQMFNFYIIAGLGLIKQRTKILSLGALINIFLNLILIRKYQALGVAFATLISFFIIWFFSYVLLYKELKQKIELKKAISLILLNSLFFIVVYVLKKIINTNIVLEIIIVCSVGVILYLLLGNFFYEKIFDRNTW